MRSNLLSVAVLFLSLFAFSSSAYADDEDIFADYNNDIRKSADAKTANVYSAWGQNMSSLIQHGLRDGLVVNGEGSYAGGKIRSDGVGNVTVDRYANVGPIINNTKLENATVVNNGGTSSNNRRW